MSDRRKNEDAWIARAILASTRERRVDACWKACQSIPTEALEAAIVEEMVGALQWAIDRIDVDGGMTAKEHLKTATKLAAILAKARP